MMDPLIESDTHALHWILDDKQMSHFLTTFFSDAKTFNQHAFPSMQPDTVVPTVSEVYHSLPPSVYDKGHRGGDVRVLQ